jgi:hypothetical protein
MANVFQYIKPDQVLDIFVTHKNGLLSQRRLCMAKIGDISLFISKITDDRMALTIENENEERIYSGESYVLSSMDKDAVTTAAEAMNRKMINIYHEDVDCKRKQIWKWYVLDWVKSRGITQEEFFNAEHDFRKEGFNGEKWDDYNTFINNSYLELGKIINIIESYELNDYDKEMLKKFAASDIMDLLREKTKEELINEAEQIKKAKRHYKFTVKVCANSKKQALKYLENLLRNESDIDISRD